MKLYVKPSKLKSGKGQEIEKVIGTPGCASFELRTPHPQHPPLAESNYNLHKPQHPSTGHPIAFGLGFGSVVGVRRHGRKKTTYTGMYLRLNTWYQVFWYRSSI